jgi:hypothetical protein
MWNSIKSILKDNKTKCVIIEDGKPVYVILPFEEYQQLQKREDRSILDEDKVNSEIQEESNASTISIGDLPF